jgi:membrane protein DedA with SNARE-associated domain/rhodanese-related sulfurtransferase
MTPAGLKCARRRSISTSAVNEIATMHGGRAAWILGVNMLLHEIGVPVPVLPTGFLFGAQAMHNVGDFLLLVAAMVVAMLVANALWFEAGRRYGIRVLQLLCRFSLSADTCVARTEQAFARWGWSSLVVGHFLPGVSPLAPPLAGALGMSRARFVALTLAGGVLFSVTVLGAGYLLRHEIDSALNRLRGLGWDAVIGAAVLIAAYIGWRWWRRVVARATDIPRISVAELEALLAAGERPLIVDVRGQAMQRIDPRRVPDAIAVPLDAIEARRDNLPQDRKIVLYCACPNEAAAAKAARLLTDRGFAWVRPLQGGLESWSVDAENSIR